jgi:ketosteroid isomerase-like protein
MSEENLDIVREQFEATNRGDFARPMADWADEIEVIAREGDIRSGTYSGREAAGEFFGGWFRAFQAHHVDLRHIRAKGDAVAVSAHFRARGRHSGIEVTDEFFFEFRLREGKIVRIKFHNSWPQALEAAGLRE